MLIMDETFIAWCPKMTKLGGLPNYSYEPREPKGLGTMLKDIAEAVIGILLYTDPYMAPSGQDKKKLVAGRCVKCSSRSSCRRGLETSPLH